MVAKVLKYNNEPLIEAYQGKYTARMYFNLHLNLYPEKVHVWDMV